MIKLKFQVVEKSERWSTRWDGERVVPAPYCGIVAQPVGGDTPENKAFFQATPSGKLEFNVVDPMAVSQLKVGTEVYITIEVDS